jgi:hypothetical protein
MVSSSCSTRDIRRVNLVMHEERTGKCLRRVEHIRGHLWHSYSIAVNQVMVATVTLSKWRWRVRAPVRTTQWLKDGICCFLVMHTALRRYNKDWLIRIKSMCPSVATCILEDCCFSELAQQIPIIHVGLLQRWHHYHLIECNLFSPWYGWDIAHLALSNNHSLTLCWYISRCWYFIQQSFTHSLLIHQSMLIL